MKIHLESDTHVEMGPWIGPSVACDVMVCAGDIGLLSNSPQLKRYFDAMRKSAEEIIWVLGNHEFYHSDYFEALEFAGKFAKQEGIHLLDEALGTENLVLNGVTFWGSTLWTDLKEGDWFVKKKVGYGFNDFHIIHDGEDSFHADQTIEINSRTREKINWDADVIITHHCPIVIEHRRFPISDITYGFCNTGLDQQIMDSNVKYWLYGHTHDSHLEDLNGTFVLSNQQGYPMSKTSSRTQYEPCFFDPSLIIEI